MDLFRGQCLGLAHPLQQQHGCILVRSKFVHFLARQCLDFLEELHIVPAQPRISTPQTIITASCTVAAAGRKGGSLCDECECAA